MPCSVTQQRVSSCSQPPATEQGGTGRKRLSTSSRPRRDSTTSVETVFVTRRVLERLSMRPRTSCGWSQRLLSPRHQASVTQTAGRRQSRRWRDSTVRTATERPIISSRPTNRSLTRRGQASRSGSAKYAEPLATGLLPSSAATRRFNQHWPGIFELCWLKHYSRAKVTVPRLSTPASREALPMDQQFKQGYRVHCRAQQPESSGCRSTRRCG